MAENPLSDEDIEKAIQNTFEKLGWSDTGQNADQEKERVFTLDGIKRKALIDFATYKQNPKVLKNEVKRIERAIKSAKTYDDWDNIVQDVNNLLETPF